MADTQDLVSTGAAGMVLGPGAAGPVSVRMFRPQPTRIFLVAPEYIPWLVAFRGMCLGAHITVLTDNQRGWVTLAEAVRGCGGTIDILSEPDNVPGQGRPYRPSLIIDEKGAITQQRQLGAWQALVVVATEDPSVSDLRNSDLALISKVEGRVGENLRRAYVLTPNQVTASMPQKDGDVVVASMRRILRITMVPGATEHRMLFSA